MAEKLLEIRGLAKRFGGLTATDNLCLDVRQGEIHALIGPNGAGKTTAIAQIFGEIASDSGSVHLAGEDITALSPPRRIRRGMARTFQITQLLNDDTALENVALAVQAQRGHSFRFFADARRDRGLTEPALALLAEVGLGPDRAATRTADLSHGERKQLELAIALATRPRLLLLDEPMAGLGASESLRMTENLGKLRGRIAILLVEHDMDAVFALADRVSVLVYGRCIASGLPEAIRADPAVREAYLTEEAG